MAEHVILLRRASPTMRYGEVVDDLRRQFNCSRRTAEYAITAANEMLRQDFLKFAADAPRTIFDAYMDIHAEAMREKNWNAARRALDSVRDMFGIKSPVIVHTGSQPPPAAYADLSDAELAVIAKLDQMPPPGSRVISAESLELKGDVLDAVEDQEDADDAR